MSVKWFFRDNDGAITEFTSRVNDPLELTIKAEEGIAAGSKVIVRDPLGTFDVRGHRKVYAVETEVADPTNRTIAVCFTGRRKVRRGSPFVGRARDWEIELTDLNTIISRRLMEGADSNRPAESDVARMQWWVATNEAALFADDFYISTENPVQMDKVDYRGQSAKQVVDDCAQQSGKNYYVFNQDTGDSATSDHNHFMPWYGHDALEERTSAIRLTNVEADVDDADPETQTTFAIDDGAELERSPDRVYSGAHVNYTRGHTYVQRESIAQDYARRDVAVPAPNVKTATKATSRGNRYLTANSTEEDIITCSVTVRAANVNMVKEGQRVQARFEHLPGYEDDYTWFRVIERTVTQIAAQYVIKLTLSGPTPGTGAGGSGAVFGILRRSERGATEAVHWDFVGDEPNGGYPTQPTVGLIEPLVDPSPPRADHPFSAWKINGTGEIDVEFFATTGGVRSRNVTYTTTFEIRHNGMVVASEAIETPADAEGLAGYGADGFCAITGLAVVPDDVITATITLEGTGMYYFGSPRGTGQSGERLAITGGSLS